MELTMREKVLALAGLAVLVASPAGAHSGSVGHGLTGGFAHPFGGGDHVVTMIALGILSHHLGRRARWLLPQLLGLGMTTGGVLAARGVALPGIEAIIAGSAMLFSATVFLGVRVAPRIVYILAAVVAVLNGHMHIAEIPAEAGLFSYGVGLLCASGVLYGCGAMVLRVFHPRAQRSPGPALPPRR